MKVRGHEWEDHGRWRECKRCGQRQYRVATKKRGSQAFTSSVVQQWVPEPEPCVWRAPGPQMPTGEEN
jgi:hypothetical protein